MTIRVAILVLNWNKADATLACLGSLAALTYPAYHVFVLDNGSTDDSVARIRACFPGTVLLETGRNLGYAGGNNVGTRYALEHNYDAILILNNDIVVAPDFLEPLVSVACSPSQPAIVTSAVCEMGRPDMIWALGAGISWHDATTSRLHSGESYSRWKEAAPFRAAYAAGSAMLAPRVIWETVGLIDEDYFLYYEEADWCVHAGRQGFPVLAMPASRVWHEVDAQQGRRSPAVTYYMTRNALRFLERNLPIRDRRLPMLRVAVKACWQMLGDVKNSQPRRAFARGRGLVDFARRRFGPMPSRG